MTLITEKADLCKLVKEIKYGNNTEIIKAHQAVGRVLAEDLFAGFTLPLKSLNNTILQQKMKSCQNNIITIPETTNYRNIERNNKAVRDKKDIIRIEEYFLKADLFSKGDLLFPKGMKLSGEDLSLLKIAKIEKVKVKTQSIISLITAETENNSNIAILKIIAGKLGLEYRVVEKSTIKKSLEDFIIHQQESDLIILDDVKKQDNNIVDFSEYQENNTYQKENIMGICCIGDRKVFHLSSLPKDFAASLIWIGNNIFKGNIDTNPVKVVLGEEMNLSKDSISSFMYLKCEKGYLVAYPLKKEDYHNKDQIIKTKAYFTMNKTKKVLERGEWIDVIRL